MFPGRRFLRLCLLVGLLGSGLFSQPLIHSPATPVEDGPHVLWKGSKARIGRVRNGRLEWEEATGRVVLTLPGIAAKPLTLQPHQPLPVQATFPMPRRILAVSDIHGRFDRLLVLLKAHKVVDDQLRWTFGKGHLVVVGDLMDRGPGVTEAMWFLKALEGAAREKGGWVHVLPGNHEAMVASGDLRYLHPKYAVPIDGLPSQPELIGPDAELGRWLRSRPLLLKLGDFLFVHGGISPELVARGLSLPQINASFRTALGQRGRAAEGDAALLLRSEGPLWYRGLLPLGKAPSATEGEITQALDHFRVKAIVVGHTTLNRVTLFHEGKVFGIDAGILDGFPGEVWLWEDGVIWRGSSEGGRERLWPSS
jgi:hypothetical protein